MSILIRGKTISEVWERTVRWCYEKGQIVETEDGAKTKEIQNAVMEISDPLLEPTIHPKYPLGKNAIQVYVDEVLKGTDADFVYDYYSRIRKHMVGDTIVDQIAQSIDKLKSDIRSRRVAIHTWYVGRDVTEKNPPCLQYIQYLIRDNTLHCTVLFRSNDLFSAALGNAIALSTLQKYVADEVGVKMGTYVHHSVSMHIYEADWSAALKILD